MTYRPVGASARRYARIEWGPRIEDQVVLRPRGGDICLGVIDAVVGTDRANQFHLRGAAHTGHLGPEMLGDLHCERSNAAGGPVD